MRDPLLRIVCRVWLCLCAATLGMTVPALRAQTLEPSQRTADRVRTPLLVGGLLTETIAITNNTPIPYLGIGFAAQRRWGAAAGYGVGEVGLLLARHQLRRGIAPSDFRRYPAIDSDTLSVRSGGRSINGHARLQAWDFAHHNAYYLRMIDIGASYQRAHALSPNMKVPLDRSSPGRLLLAPFVAKNLASAWTLVPIAAAGLSGLSTARSPRGLRDVSRMTVLGQPMSRNAATAAVLGYEAVYLLSTAVGEEMFFRGLVQTELTERYSRQGALIGSTAAFAAFHYPNHGLRGTLIAAAAGAYIGYRFQQNGYNLREVAAMHFWLDYLPTAIQFLRDPRSGRPVYDVRWPTK